MKGVVRSVIVVGDAGAAVGSAGFYIDVSEAVGRAVRESVDELVAEISSSRADIEQAKGMLMLAYGISADRAFDILVWCSQQSNAKVRGVAESFLERVRDQFQLPNGLRSQIDHLLLGRR
ncbi:ANTAR domain-containing protein [Rhodococcus qingshengii]|uniref:ANTAR domain-containing protein n=1 Tax=Rhodococcus qingshengii TaxID=334542 RepID=UPI0030B91FB2